ncbi:MAG TPA: DUF4199 domain-containing protein [Lacunisphaera sp.]|nr:DUF4199 domain-containing protein [Lacunisphaera sp.]
MKPEIKYGLACGAALCAWIALEYLLGFHTTRPDLGAWTGLLSNLIPLVVLFLLLRKKRAALFDGRLSLGAGIGAGLLTSFVAALLVYCFLAGYTTYLNPTWIDQALEHKVALWRAEQVAEVEIQGRIVRYRGAYTPVGLLGNTLVGMTLRGGLLGLGLTVLLRRLPHRPD